jgi:trehalose 6-phosphate synthase
VTVAGPIFDLVVAANRLPVERARDASGASTWHRSPGGLVTALESVMRGRDAAWVGWAGEPGPAPEPFCDDGMHLQPVGLSPTEIHDYYEGFSNETLWPIYHDVIVPATFHRVWWNTYRRVNHRFAQAVAEVAAPGATVWVHDYQLQLVPAMLRAIRPDVRIGWFNHIPFPPVELFAQLPWRRALVEGLLGADFLGFQRTADARNFLRCCRRLLGMSTKGDTVTFTPPGDDLTARRTVRACAIPISVDFRGLDELSRTPEVIARAAEIRASLGNPKTLMLGVDRLDYTKGIRHQLKAYEELLQDKAIGPPDEVLMQVATPSRERVDAYRRLREEVEGIVGCINGEFSAIGQPAVHYLHHFYPRAELAAMFLAADVMLVTPLRDGMNLIAKEYVACRHDLSGALVLSEFAGAWHELHQAYICNPHDIEGVKQTIMRALTAPDAERRGRMKALRKRVAGHDVQRWASRYLDALASAPAEPQWSTHTSDAEREGVKQANKANLRASDQASERTGPVTQK